MKHSARDRDQHTDHAVGGEVLVLCLQVDSVLVVLTDFCHTLHEQLFAVGDPLRHLRQGEAAATETVQTAALDLHSNDAKLD